MGSTAAGDLETGRGEVSGKLATDVSGASASSVWDAWGWGVLAADDMDVWDADD